MTENLKFGDHIYVAGPLGSKGLAWRNVREACLVGAEVFKEGFNPYVPHLMMTFDMIVDLQDEAKYRAHGLSFVPKCSGVVVFGFADFESLTGGTKGEVDLALELGLPVWYGLETFREVCLFLRRRQRRNLLR